MGRILKAISKIILRARRVVFFCSSKRVLIVILGGLLLQLTILFYSQSEESKITYRVQRGDTLGGILIKMGFAPLWGKNGKVNQTLPFNPPLITKRGNHLKPNAIIILPALRSQKRVPSSTAENHELSFERPFERHNEFSFTPSFYYSKLTGTDKNNGTVGRVLSKPNLSLTTTWYQVWCPEFKSFVYFGIDRSEFLSSTTKTVTTIQPVTYLFGLGSEWQFSEKDTLGVSLGMSEEHFYDGAGSGYEVGAVRTINMQPYLSHDFIEAHPFTISGEMRGFLFLPGQSNSYSTQLGYGVQGKLEIGSQFKDFSLKAGPYYRQKFQDTSVLIQKEEDIGITLSMSFKIGSPKK